ncbi:MAG: beta-lactamase family protein [Verrucomicrobia bacterium]|nr:beta-lactamase family protein [Verrucomicrobiota bacterium]
MQTRFRFRSPILAILLASVGVLLASMRAVAADAATALETVPRALQQFVDDRTIAGAVTLVARQDRVLRVDAIGQADLATGAPMRPDALFWIASMTKPMAAVAVLMLQDEGKLNVADPVEKHLPEFKGQWLVSERSNERLVLVRSPRPITIRELLTHSSGLTDVPAPRPHSTLAEQVVAYSQQPLRFPPGSKWEYSNPGINTLGRIVEVIAGEPFAEFLERRLLRPLGMSDTTFWPTEAQARRLAKSYQPKAGGGLEEIGISFIQGELADRKRAPRPAGGLFSTAADVARFYQMMLQDGVWQGQRLLTSEAVRQLTHTQSGELRTGFTDGMSWGFGFQVVKEPQGVTAMLAPGTFGHGGAYGTQSWADPKQDLILVLMIQRARLPNSDASDLRRVFQDAAVNAIRN